MQDLNKPIIDLDTPGSNDPALTDTKFRELFSIFGTIEVVTVIPTAPADRFYSQFKLYTDDITTPTVFRLYIYMPRIMLWKYITLS